MLPYAKHTHLKRRSRENLPELKNAETASSNLDMVYQFLLNEGLVVEE